MLNVMLCYVIIPFFFFFFPCGRSVLGEVRRASVRLTFAMPTRRRGGPALVQSFDPPVGAIYRITCSVRKGDLLVRLPGLRKHCGTFRFRLLPPDDSEGHFMEYASGAYVERKCCRVSLSDVSIEVARAVASLLADPPIDDLYVHSRPALVPLRPAGMVGLPIALGTSRLPSRSLHDILYGNPRKPALPLSKNNYAYRAIRAWGVPIVTTTSCIVYGTAESTLRAHHRHCTPISRRRSSCSSCAAPPCLYLLGSV